MTNRFQQPEGRADPSIKRASEADHRISNSLAVIASMVRLKAAKAPAPDDPAEFLLEIAERIDTVARLHRHMAHAASGAVHLGDYLRGIGDRMSRALANGGTFVTVDCAPSVIVPFDVALPLGLMAAELLTNSFKYAHPSGLAVKAALSCTQTGDGALRVVYEDDGVGFPESFDVAQDGRLGMRFIQLQSEQLGGSSEWTSDALGVRFEITIPAPRLAESA